MDRNINQFKLLIHSVHIAYSVMIKISDNQFRNNLISVKQVLIFFFIWNNKIQFENKITMSNICTSICSRLSI